jgi:hypothetical protein
MSPSEEELAGRAFRRLIAARDTLILAQHAPPDPGRYRKVNDYLIEEYGVQLWTAPITGEKGLPIIYHFKARGIYFDLKHLLTFQRPGHSIEFWATLIGGEDWASIARQQRFSLVRMVDADASRQIIHDSDTFSPTLSVAGGEDIVLPLDDARLVHELKPEAFPETYAGTPLEGVSAHIDDSGAYRLDPPQ